MDREIVSKTLKTLGFKNHEILIFFALIKNGPLTISEISKYTQIPRTTVHRVIIMMLKKELVERIIKHKFNLIKAQDPEYLKVILKEKVSTINNVEKNINSVVSSLKAYSTPAIKRTEVMYYEGREGIKQLLWNELSAKTEVLSLTYRTLSEITGKEFIIRWWNENIQRKIKNKCIGNPGTSEMKNAVDKDIKEKYLPTPPILLEERIIKKNVIKIIQETFLYNNVYAIVQWDRNQAFGIEIYNEVVADQEREIFKILWKMAKPI